jgi:hypothetical protein
LSANFSAETEIPKNWHLDGPLIRVVSVAVQQQRRQRDERDVERRLGFHRDAVTPTVSIVYVGMSSHLGAVDRFFLMALIFFSRSL